MSSRDEGLNPLEAMARSSARKKRRISVDDMVSKKGTLDIVERMTQDESCPEPLKVLLSKMRNAGVLDDATEPEVIRFLSENWAQLFSSAREAVDKADLGFTVIKDIVVGCEEPLAKISPAFSINYTSLVEPELKCIFWTLYAAYLIIHYEYSTDSLFEIPMLTQDEDFTDFFRMYPEFLIRTWDSKDLLQFKLCMEAALRAFGCKNNMCCMVEFVTFLVKGRNVALCCNTSGGGLRDLDRPTEVSTEKCRVLVYHRESGGTPRKRKQGYSLPMGVDINQMYIHHPGVAISAPNVVYTHAVSTEPMMYQHPPVMNQQSYAYPVSYAYPASYAPAPMHMPQPQYFPQPQMHPHMQSRMHPQMHAYMQPQYAEYMPMPSVQYPQQVPGPGYPTYGEQPPGW